MFSLKSEERTGADPNEYISVQLWKQTSSGSPAEGKKGLGIGILFLLSILYFFVSFLTFSVVWPWVPNQHTQYEQFTAIKPWSREPRTLWSFPFPSSYV